ncbi:MAG: cell division protein ZapE [Bdellovibrionales bacterium]
MTDNPLTIYRERVGRGVLKPDNVQVKAIEALDQLYYELLDYKPKRGWFAKPQEPPRGVYFYGGVGRGKSMVMDLFVDCLPDYVPAQRVHFHEFMISVHDYVHARRSDDSIRQDADESIPLFAARIAEKYRVLCFDEFHVVDIADAMILGRLYRNLFERGVVIVSTSNWEPDRLYEGGLQRDRFLASIALIKERMQVFYLDSLCDYRTQFLMEEGSYFTSLDEEAEIHIDNVFKALSDNALVVSESLNVKGRVIEVREAAKGVARFSFDDLCAQPLGAEDYLKICETYHSVLLEAVPVMEQENRNEMKRFMNLIDVLYENDVRFVMSAAALPEKLYSGDDHAYEFERTVSRLKEMQSGDYIAKKR